jgi:hypothetical protein
MQWINLRNSMFIKITLMQHALLLPQYTKVTFGSDQTGTIIH